MKRLKSILLFSLLTVAFCEILIWYFLDGRKKKILSFIRPYLIGGICIIFLTHSFFFFITTHWQISFFLSFLLLVLLTIIHIVKFNMIGLPLYFWDYRMVKEILPYIPKLVQSGFFYLYSFLSLLGVGGVIVFLSLFYPQPSSLGDRSVFLLFSIVITTFFFLLVRVPYKKIFPANSNRDCVVFKTGLFAFLGFTVRHMWHVKVPERYNPATIELIDELYPKLNSSEGQKRKLPNILFYVMESFMDIHSMGIRFSEDPVPFFTSLGKGGRNSNIVSPTFGEQTIQVEFELFTGLSQYQLNNPNPFTYIVQQNRSFPSLISFLKDHGYDCSWAVAEPRVAFQRESVARLLQFDRFDSFQDGVPKNFEGLINGEVPDSYVVRQFIDELPESRPFFAYIMTNSTHAGYHHWDRLPQCRVLNDHLSSSTRETIEQYAASLRQADQALEQLIQHFEKQEEDTIIFTYGDHRPGLSKVFDELRLFQGENFFQKYDTPLRVWSNFQRNPIQWNRISINMMTGYLQEVLPFDFRSAPLPLRVCQKMYEEFSVVSHYLETKEGKFFSRSSQDQEIFKHYSLLEYDLLHGRQDSLTL